MTFENLKDLPRTECLLAMEVLWQSLSRTPAEDVIPEWHQKVLATRLEQLRNGEEKTIPWNQAKEHLRTLTTLTNNH
jgi:hypothetical protein